MGLETRQGASQISVVLKVPQSGFGGFNRLARLGRLPRRRKTAIA
jgi:hypothetical protein